MEAQTASDSVKIPIAVLKVGESRVVQPELEFPFGPVTFTLIDGDGPIYIHGQQVPNGYEDQVAAGDEFDDDSDEETVCSDFIAVFFADLLMRFLIQF